MYNKILTGILIFLIMVISGIVGYLAYWNVYKKVTLNADAEEFLQEFDTLIVPVANQEEQPPEENNNEQQNPTTRPNTSNNTMAGVSTNGLTYKGFKVIGKLEMPTINIQYPILDVITHANAIEVSVGMLYGVGINKPGNTVIIGHNYNNGLFFGKNKRLKIGEKIYITDLEGNRVEYTIYNKYTTPESDTSYITRQTEGRTEVTLVTCDATGKNRLVVCARIE